MKIRKFSVFAKVNSAATKAAGREWAKLLKAKASRPRKKAVQQ